MDWRTHSYRVGPHIDQRDDVPDEPGELILGVCTPQTVNQLDQRTRTGEFSAVSK